ncbi:MAG: hypothetical protein KAJ98_09140, partial [Spirochaetaceae bacterium]|nr:hypothetical protein [Spirochaetaceae bacterium]
KPDQVIHSGSIELLSELLDIELCVTPEIRNEISRQDDSNIRRKVMGHISMFPVIQSKGIETSSSIQSIRDNFPEKLTVQDESDLKHLEHCLASGAQYFITQDEELISRFSKCDLDDRLNVMRPWELIVHIDTLRNKLAYEPSLLSGCSITVKRPSINDLPAVIKAFKEPNRDMIESCG